MSLSNGPNVSTDGLQLCLDAGNSKSYSPNVFLTPLDIVGFFGTGANAATITRDATVTDSPAGGVPLKMAISGNDPYTGTYSSATYNIAPAAQGQTWTISVWVKASTTVSGVEGPAVMEANSSGTYLTGTSGSFTVGTSWTRISVTRTLTDATVAYVQCRFDGPNTGGTGINIWWDGLQVERASSASTFNPMQNRNGQSWYDTANYSIYGASNYTYPTFASNYFTFVNNGTTVNNIYTTTQNISTASQTTYTRIAWFYITSLSSDATGIIQNSIGNNKDMALALSSGNKLGFYQYTKTTSSGTVDGDYSVFGSTTLSLNTWYQGAITVNRTANTLSIYVNGVLDTSTSINSIGLSSSDTIVIGGATTDSYSGARMFKGRIAAVYHYNKVLSASEILANFEALRGRFGI